MPPPLPWLVDDLIPEGYLSLLVGDGGTGKSLLALHLCLCIAAGREFLGKEVQQGQVLYLDYELDRRMLLRRAFKVAAGMKLDLQGPLVTDKIYYRSPKYPLGTKDHAEETGNLIRKMSPDLIVLDSLTEAAVGDMKDHADFNRIARRVREWPTTLGIDHVSQAEAKRKSKNARPFGSVFKRNIARSTINLDQKSDGVHLLQQDKSNFSEGNERLAYEMDFSRNEITFEYLNREHEVDAFLSELSTHEVTLTAIRRIYRNNETAVSKDELVEWRESKGQGIGKGTVRNHYTKLEDQEKIERHRGKGAVPVNDPDVSAGR